MGSSRKLPTSASRQSVRGPLRRQIAESPKDRERRTLALATTRTKTPRATPIDKAGATVKGSRALRENQIKLEA